MVNESFETNVDCVYAAGPVARFDGAEGNASGDERRYNSLEIGGRVADVLMKRLRVRDDYDDGTDAAAEFSRPLSIRCRLPGGYNYLRCVVPGPSRARTLPHTIKTGDVATGYFEIVVDNNGNVTRLSCYSKTVSVGRGKSPHGDPRSASIVLFFFIVAPAAGTGHSRIFTAPALTFSFRRITRTDCDKPFF